jgi:hypothetical protein
MDVVREITEFYRKGRMGLQVEFLPGGREHCMQEIKEEFLFCVIFISSFIWRWEGHLYHFLSSMGLGKDLGWLMHIVLILRYSKSMWEEISTLI